MDSSSEEVVERQTQEQSDLVLPAHSSRPSPSDPQPQRRLTLFRALQAVRAAVGAVLDWADAAADAVTKGLQGRS
jgi:hypothetical protein